MEHMSRMADDMKDEMLHQEPMNNNVDEDIKESSEKMEVEKREDGENNDLFNALGIDVADEETITSGEEG